MIIRLRSSIRKQNGGKLSDAGLAGDESSRQGKCALLSRRRAEGNGLFVLIVGFGSGPTAFVEHVHVAAQEIEVHIPDKDAPIEDRVADARGLEEFLRETGEQDPFGRNLRAEAGQLADLPGREVGLDIVGEGVDDGGDARRHARADKFIAQGAQDAVLVVGA